MPSERILALDAMGVVYATRSITSEVVIPFLREHSCTITDRDIRWLYEEASKGRMTSASFWRRLGLDPSVEAECLRRYVLMPGLSEFLAWARESFDGLYMLTNDVTEWSEALRGRFDLDRWFDDVLVSGDLGIRKPQRRAFRALVDRAGVTAVEMVFVDDKIANLDAAAALGMRTVHLAPREEAESDHAHAPDLAHLRLHLES
ncbi:HAD family hydrolase [Magnetospira sp. QH-2]|uniref:HAD family hydrolase n=1 Tax=Magnetospira sp. (strain QH-2) TaxID=1288970 RepID=UPI0003E81860|nr:HAD-IA family hydrolase [Magnetospira sp. QH-2]CCQ73181.1 Putative haloacid dehalogenase superfamily protein, subfamily IA, variant 3 with third motif having DD or ED [Magnetospira sp. QH-2]